MSLKNASVLLKDQSRSSNGSVNGNLFASMPAMHTNYIRKEVCCVSGCLTGTKNCPASENGLSFHVFPSKDQPERLQKWIKILNIRKLKKNLLICSRHFCNSDFFTINSTQKGQLYRVLRKTAIPTRFLVTSTPTIELEVDDDSEDTLSDIEMSQTVEKGRPTANVYVTNQYQPPTTEIKTFCRCCLKLDPNSRNMKDVDMILDGSTINLFSAFFDCTSFKVLKIDDQAQICDQCVIDLERTIVFLSHCQTSNELINNIFGNDPADDDTDGEDLLVPMRVDDAGPVVQIPLETVTKSIPESSPLKIVKAETIPKVDYDEIISADQVQAPKTGYAVKRVTSSVPQATTNKRKSNQIPFSNELIGETVDGKDSEWTVKSMYNDLQMPRKKGRPKKNQLSNPNQSMSDGDITQNPVEMATTDEPKPKKKYSKWVYLSSPPQQPDLKDPVLVDVNKTIKKRLPYACNECDESFRLQVYLRYHQKSVHTKPMATSMVQGSLAQPLLLTKDPKYTCKRCYRVLDTIDEWNEHQKEHIYHKKPKFECSMCQIGFFLNERFEAHIAKDHNLTMESYTPKYQCSRCDVNFHMAEDFYYHPRFCKGIRKSGSALKAPAASGKQTKNQLVDKQSKNFLEIPPNFLFCYNCNTGYLEKKYFDQHLDDCYTNTQLFLKCCICDVDVHLIDCNFKWPDRVSYKLHLMSDHQIKYKPEIHGPQENIRNSCESDDDFFGF